ncbi:MAG: hypothetical protein ACD_48C00001G0004, partial [uncultured bacterium]
MASSPKSSRAFRTDIWTLFFVVLLDLIGIGIIIPILAPLLLGNATTLVSASVDTGTRIIILGFLTGVYPLAQFFGAPILGALSDRYGRKPVLLVSLLGTFLGYLLFGIGIVTGQLWLLFASRLLDGFTGGNISVAQSAIADMVEPKDRTKYFGLIGMAFGLGFIIGPFLGGVMSDSSIVSWFTFATPFWVAAGLSLLNIVFVIRFFVESLKNKIHTPINALTGFRNIGKALAMPNLRSLFGSVFLFMFGFTFFTQFFQVYLIEKFQYTQGDIGLLFGYVGISIAITQGVFVRLAAKKYTPTQVLSVSYLLLAMTFFIILAVPTAWMLFLVMPFVSIFNGFGMPNATSLAS